MAVEIFGGHKWVVGLGDVTGQQGRDQTSLALISIVYGLGKPLAIDSDLPRQHPSGKKLGPAIFGQGGLVFREGEIVRKEILRKLR